MNPIDPVERFGKDDEFVTGVWLLPESEQDFTEQQKQSGSWFQIAFESFTFN